MRKILLIIFSLVLGATLYAQDHSGHDHSDHQSHSTHSTSDKNTHENHSACGDHHESSVFDPAGTAFHHISDANVYSIGPLNIPLPCMLYNKDDGFQFFMSSKFEIGHHGTGHKAVGNYVLDAGTVKRVVGPGFHRDAVVDGFIHEDTKNAKGKKVVISYACSGGEKYLLESKSTIDGGLFGGGWTGFQDFSITKNVMTMFLVFVFMFWLLFKVKKAYTTRDGKAPSGVQGLIEVIFVFMQDEVIRPFLGDQTLKFIPFLMSLFFFILGLNLFGQIPFFGGSNVTGNLSFTLVLAVFAFFVVNLNGKKDYWGHIFWMPGVPAVVKLIITPVEILGIFIKPITLMLRLFANMVAGHMVIVIFVGLIFVFGNMGANTAAGFGTSIASAALVLFMSAIELLVAFLQAYVFVILTSSYIGAAIEEHH